MTIRIWHQSMVSFDNLGFYAKALADHAKAVISEGTEVVFHGVPAASYGGRAPAEVMKYPYANHLILSQALESCYQAEREGFDVVAIASYCDPFLRQARSLVDISIASMAESTLLVGCSMAKYMALITLAPENVRRVREIVERQGLEKRVSGVYVLDPPINERELGRAFEDPAKFIAGFTRVAEKAIAEGADLIIPAEGVFNEVLFAHRVNRMGNVSIMDCVGVVFMYAELLVNLKRRVGLAVGRRWEYTKPDPSLIADLRRLSGLP